MPDRNNVTGPGRGTGFEIPSLPGCDEPFGDHRDPVDVDPTFETGWKTALFVTGYQVLVVLVVALVFVVPAVFLAHLIANLAGFAWGLV